MSIARLHTNRRQALVGLAALGLAPMKSHALPRAMPMSRAPMPDRVPAAEPDAVTLAPPSAVQLGGWLGGRVALNARQRLLKIDTEPLLAGFRHKPGSHPWIGEHVGKWLHAATLAWANNGDAALRAKLDRVAAELIATQEADGYLGTYTPDKRLALHEGADWDVWSHKYVMLGLLTYHQYTADAPALQASRRAADLLLATFPAQRSILAAGTHQGMAATSVLEPMVLLYRLTGEARHLDFARYLVRAWNEAQGPRIVETLLTEHSVAKVANGKAYEMLSNLVGLCELARVTGDRRLRQAALIAWQDIADNRLYLTGTTSQYEHFQPDGDQRGDVRAHVGETCVTTTWIQFNLALLQLTGEARFANELERSFYNHLTAAQHPDGEDWCYFTATDGRKHHDKGITCCHSSGPRGLALAPQAAYLRRSEKGRDTLLVSTFEPSSAHFTLGGQAVTVEQHSGFPYRGEARLVLRMARPAAFAIRVRVPEWARPLVIDGAVEHAGWAELPRRTWKDGDTVPLRFQLASRVHSGERVQAGRAALAWGPFVLACEQADNPGLGASHRLTLTPAAAAIQASAAPALRFEAEVIDRAEARRRAVRLRPFADAGAGGGLFRVWMRAPGLEAAGPGESLLIDGRESRSRPGADHGPQPGSLIGEDFECSVTTADGQRADEDWYAVTLSQPVSARRFVFTHGRVAKDGGWFDTRSGKPRVQVQRSAGAPWDTIGILADYPATTDTQANGVEQWDRDARHTLQLPAPERFVAVRVIGVPACGDKPSQAHSSCAQLQAFSQ